MLQSTSGPIGNLELQVRDFSFQNNLIYIAGQHLIPENDNIAALAYNGQNWEVQFLFYTPVPPILAPSQRYNKIMVANDKLFLGSDEYILLTERNFPLSYFKRISGIWVPQTIYYGTGESGVDDYFGSTMAIDGNHLLVGAPREGMIREGKAYVFDMTLGVSQFDRKSVAVYPNPTKDKIYFENAAVTNAKVYSMTGNLLLSSNGELTELSLQNLSQGIYLVKTNTTDGQSQTFKIIKN